ncbi:MAG: IS1380 family transposase [Burkholderiaceae bacterium]
MPDCTETKVEFGRIGRRVIEADFDGGRLGSDGGVMLLRQLDERLGLTRAAAAAIGDARNPMLIAHDLRDLLAQRIYAMCCGYEDLNDHAVLREDVLMQTAVGVKDTMASSPTLCRLENRTSRAQSVALHGVLVDQFIASHESAPERIVLDIDASDVPLHGEQQRREFHAYYDHHCYLPLYVFCGQAMLVCYLRNSKIDGAKHAGAVIRLLVNRIRRSWPEVQIVVRGDSGFCRQGLIRWCERAGVSYVIGLARNNRLEDRVALVQMAMREAYERSGVKQREIGEFTYAADTWDRERRVVTRLEYGEQGVNPRFVVTNLDEPAEELYDEIYCARGEAENRIKEAQLDLFGTRASCHRFNANQMRLLLAGLAYTLMTRLRAIALHGTELASCSAATIRVRLLKIGAQVWRNTRRIRLALASHHPLRDVYLLAAHRLAASP